jgi:hypothetical protein
MSNREEYVRIMQAKLEEWNADIDVLAAKAEGVKEDLKHEYTEQIEALKVKQTEAKQKIEELQLTGEVAWEDIKAGAELAWGAISEAIDSAKSRFK